MKYERRLQKHWEGKRVPFPSLLLPLKALLMNVLSVSAAYGVLVFIFQWGNFSNILGFTSSGFIDSLIPILLFCILFGLSMDWESSGPRF
jgi:putative drug exporter of the RND superfamily